MPLVIFNVAGAGVTLTVPSNNESYLLPLAGPISLNATVDSPTGEATASLGVVSIAVTAGGSGYSTAPAVAIEPISGFAASATAVINAGKVVAINVNNRGSAFTTVPAVTISGGGGSGAIATASLGVVAVTITNPGLGYGVAPAVGFVGGGGTGTTATAILSGGSVSSVSMNTTGADYTSVPTVSFTASPVTIIEVSILFNNERQLCRYKDEIRSNLGYRCKTACKTDQV